MEGYQNIMTKAVVDVILICIGIGTGKLSSHMRMKMILSAKSRRIESAWHAWHINLSSLLQSFNTNIFPTTRDRHVYSASSNSKP